MIDVAALTVGLFLSVALVLTEEGRIPWLYVLAAFLLGVGGEGLFG